MKVYTDRNITIIEEDDGSLNYIPTNKTYYNVRGNEVTITSKNGNYFIIKDITTVLDVNDVPYTDINSFVDSSLIRIPIPSNLLSYEKLVLVAWNTATQTPTAAETPMIINWNTIFFQDSEYIDVLPSGIIVSKKGVKLQSSFSANVSRAGSGSVSKSFGRICKNNVQQGGSLESSLDGSSDKQPLIDTSYFNCAANDQIKYEFYNEGSNKGSLKSTIPSLYPSWNPVYSSAIVIRTNDGLI